jgi:hypothetical protein
MDAIKYSKKYASVGVELSALTENNLSLDRSPVYFINLSF